MDERCTSFICDFSFSVNWSGLGALVVTALAVALVARMWSGGFGEPWGGHRPLIWFLVVVLLPPVGVVLFGVAAAQQLRARSQR